MNDSHTLPPEVNELLAGHAEYRRRLARFSFEEKIVIIERMRVLNSWRQQHEKSYFINPTGDTKDWKF